MQSKYYEEVDEIQEALNQIGRDIRTKERIEERERRQEVWAKRVLWVAGTVLLCALAWKVGEWLAR